MTHVVVLGAGAIGLSVGARWSAVLGSVTLVGRAGVLDGLDEGALHLDARRLGPLTLRSDPAALADADLIVLAMKAHALDAAMDEIAAHAQADAVILSLLNGLEPVRRLRARFPERAVLAGMVPFNVVWTGPASLKTSGQGRVSLERAPLTDWIASHVGDVALYDDLAPVQWGKLLLNLVGGVNALSGLPLHQMLSDRNYRRVYAAVLSEALRAYRAAGIAFEVVGPTHPRLAIPVLKSPNWLFRTLVLKKQNLDQSSMTSLAVDLAAGRPTEVEIIHGEICRLGAQTGMSTPVNAMLMDLVQEREQSGDAAPISGADLWRATRAAIQR